MFLIKYCLSEYKNSSYDGHRREQGIQTSKLSQNWNGEGGKLLRKIGEVTQDLSHLLKFSMIRDRDEWVP